MDNITQKPRNVADTSKLSFQLLLDSGQNLTDQQTVLAAIQERGNVNSRQLSRITNLERSSVTRAIADLELDGKIYVCAKKPCPITSRIVKFYDLTDRQLNLFQ